MQRQNFQCPIHQQPLRVVIRSKIGLSQGKCARCLEEQEIPIDLVQQEYHTLAQERIGKLENLKQTSEKQLLQLKDQFLQIREEFNKELNKIISKITDRISEVDNNFMNRINQIKEQSQTIQKMEKCIAELKREKKNSKQIYETIAEDTNKQLITYSVQDFTKLLTQLSCLPAKLKNFTDIEKSDQIPLKGNQSRNEQTSSIDRRKRVKLPTVKQKDIKYASEADWKKNLQKQQCMLKAIIARGRKNKLD